MKINKYICLLTFILAILGFSNLSEQYLWQDEAENAVIAQNILKYHYPRALDGTHLVISDIGYQSDHTWIFQPWLQNYVTAASFIVFGKSTVSARIPFVILGILSFFASYKLAKRLFDRKTANISSTILVFCVPFVLMIRSSRYYSLALFFSLLLIISYLDYAEKKRFSQLSIVISSFMLFNSNFGIFFPLLLGLAVHYFIFYFKKENLKRDLSTAGAIMLATLPVFIFFKGWMHKVPLTIDFFMGNIKFYFRGINKYIAPIRLIAILYFVYALLKRNFLPFKINGRNKVNLALIGIIFLASLLFMGIAKFRSLRYVIYLIPLVIIFESYLLSFLWMKKRAVAVVCIALLAFTDLFHHSLDDFFEIPFSRLAVNIYDKFGPKPDAPKFVKKIKKSAEKTITVKTYFFDFLYELTHAYEGPVEAIVGYLKQNAEFGDTVKIPYGDCAVAFYTNLNVENNLYSFKNLYPEWIVVRNYWTSDDFFKSKYFTEIEKRYDKIILDAPDLRWENRPDDMGYHNFRTVTDYPYKVTIYKRRS